MNMEWRPEYLIHVDAQETTAAGDSSLSVWRETPPGSAAQFGIYNHFLVTANSTIGHPNGQPEMSSKTVRIVPRFLFGIPHDVIEQIYGKAFASVICTRVLISHTHLKKSLPICVFS